MFTMTRVDYYVDKKITFMRKYYEMSFCEEQQLFECYKDDWDKP